MYLLGVLCLIAAAAALPVSEVEVNDSVSVLPEPKSGENNELANVADHLPLPIQPVVVPDQNSDESKKSPVSAEKPKPEKDDVVKPDDVEKVVIEQPKESKEENIISKEPKEEKKESTEVKKDSNEEKKDSNESKEKLPAIMQPIEEEEIPIIVQFEPEKKPPSLSSILSSLHFPLHLPNFHLPSFHWPPFFRERRGRHSINRYHEPSIYIIKESDLDFDE